MKKLSLYQKSLIIFSLILLLLFSSFLIYVYKTLQLYEKNLPENYLKRVLANGEVLKRSDIPNNNPNKYEKDIDYKEALQKLYQDKSLKINANGDSYDIYVHDKLISNVKLRLKEKYRRILILNIEKWEIKDVKQYLEDGIYNYTLEIPENYQVYINNIKLDKQDMVKESVLFDLGKMSKLVNLPKQNFYELKGFIYEPKIKIYDENNEEIAFKQEENMVIQKDYPFYKTFEEAKIRLKSKIDILTLAQNWSLFLSNDLKGETRGFNLISPYLLAGTDLYNLALRWSKSIDIEWISTHKLKDPIFTNTRVENCLFYDENAFSCEVYLEKNMVVSKRDEIDIMHDRMYFIYYKGGYKLVDLKAVVEKE